MNTLGDLVYSQQKNREHCWNQAKEERRQMKLEWDDRRWRESDDLWVEDRFTFLCQKANITA